MFEEEAEEYKDNTRIKDKNTYIGFPDERISEVQDFEGNYIDISERIIKTFKDASEFGYNKAMDEMQEQGLALQSDMDKTIEQNIALKKELEKANEWHYVKDGDYPKDNKPVLCILGDIDSDNCEVGYYNNDGSGEPWHFETYQLPDDDGDNAWGVYAWKEIVLPKESVMTKEECEIETSKAIMEMRNHIEELEKENAELKRGYHYEAEVINGRPTGKAILVFNLAYAKSIIKDLLDNSDEYAKQRAKEFLE